RSAQTNEQTNFIRRRRSLEESFCMGALYQTSPPAARRSHELPSGPMIRTPDLGRRAFARTNSETVAQRVALLRELCPGAASIGELCCGDCSRQHAAYRDELGVGRYRALDIEPEIARENRA